MRTLHALTIIMSAQQLSIACQAAGSTTARKALIRKHIKDVLQVLPEEDIVGKSSAILNRLCGMQEYRDSKCVCLYLSMPAGEVQSYRILQDAFDNGKRVFIPKVAGKNSQDLKIFELSSYSMISEFPKSKWGIPEPTKEFTDIAVDATYLGLVDCVILPGVAFDSSCGRVGHGKGYYDSFLERVSAANQAAGKSRPVTIGIAFDEQILEDSIIPMDPHDKVLDFVITPTSAYTTLK